MSKDLPWRRVAAEGVVIVASILMAFGNRRLVGGARAEGCRAE
jgi:hypothetical protein